MIAGKNDTVFSGDSGVPSYRIRPGNAARSEFFDIRIKKARVQQCRQVPTGFIAFHSRLPDTPSRLSDAVKGPSQQGLPANPSAVGWPHLFPVGQAFQPDASDAPMFTAQSRVRCADQPHDFRSAQRTLHSEATGSFCPKQFKSSEGVRQHSGSARIAS
jgi:hypothetical protein